MVLKPGTKWYNCSLQKIKKIKYSSEIRLQFYQKERRLNWIYEKVENVKSSIKNTYISWNPFLWLTNVQNFSTFDRFICISDDEWKRKFFGKISLQIILLRLFHLLLIILKNGNGLLQHSKNNERTRFLFKTERLDNVI